MQLHVEKHNLSKKNKQTFDGTDESAKNTHCHTSFKWYIEHGIAVTKVNEMVEFQAQTCFENFVREVSDVRRQGDLHPDMAIIGETKKMVGNSGYGSLVIDKTRHRTIKYVQGEKQACVLVNRPQFRKL